MDNVSVVIPVLKGREWNRDRTLNLPNGTPYVIAEYEHEHEWASAMTQGVEAADTELVILGGPDVWLEREPEAIPFLADLCWDADVTYGNVCNWKTDRPTWSAPGEMFCPNRLRFENFLPPIACVRRDLFLKAGGVTSGLWDLWVRMLDAGARFKYVPEAHAAVDIDQVGPDPSPKPVTALEPQATFYFQSTPGTTYWRCLLPARHLPGMAAFNLPKRVMVDGKMTMPEHKGAAVFQFAGNLEHLAVIKHMRDQGIRVLMEVDDNYVSWFPLMKNAGWSKNASGLGYSVETHRATLKLVDGVICTTETLAKQYRRYNENVWVCPNQIDPADWPEPEKPDDGVFRIGWFASASHKDDGQMIGRALDWASKQPDVEVVMIGTGATFTKNAKTGEMVGKPWWPITFKHCPWSNDFGVYRKFLAELDVGLCPVKPNPWSVCRSDLKALEYGMAQAYPVVSDVHPYDTVDVPKARTPKDWLRIVQELVRDRDETREKARLWRDYVLSERTVERNIHLWEDAVHGRRSESPDRQRVARGEGDPGGRNRRGSWSDRVLAPQLVASVAVAADAQTTIEE